MKKIVILFICILLTGCTLYDEYKMPKDVKLTTNDKTYEVYSKGKIKELINDANVEILNKSDEINTKKTGKKTVTIKYKYKKRTYKLDVSYKVVDTTKPTVLYAPKSYTYYLNDDTEDFCSNTSTIDNYDRNVKCEIFGEYDVTKENNYNLKYLFKDKSGNTLEEDFIVSIIDPEKISDDNNYDEDIENIEEIKVQFSDIVNIHKNDKTMIGIDISRWQGNVDFNKIKKAGCEFVIIRMAVSNGKDDEIGLDSYYKTNIKNAKKAGLKVGVYVYTSASSVDEIKSQAKFVRKKLNKIKLDFPIAYDFESWREINELKVNKYDLMNYVNEFYKIVHKDGYDVMLYSSKFYLENVWENKDYPVWLAHYIDQTNYEGKYILWQLASDGQIDGIDGDVDIDVYYKNEN